MPLHGEYAPSPSDWARKQAEAFEASGGTEANTLRGVPIILLTSVGARSGKLRKTPLMRVEHAGTYAAVASTRGGDRHPDWYANVLAHPRVTLRDGNLVLELVAREVTGAERSRWWSLACTVFPSYVDYQRRTRRRIPVLLLEQAPEGGSRTA